MTYEQWHIAVTRYLDEVQFGPIHFMNQTNLRGLYDSGHTVKQGADAVLEVAARHGNEDAKQLIKRNKELFG